MGRIPPINITYLDKGYTSGFIQVGSSKFATEIEKVELFSETFQNLGDFEDKRNQVANKYNTYILEEETIRYNKAFYVLIPDIDYPNKERLNSKLSDMKKKLYKGEVTDYYFQGFETFTDKEIFRQYIDHNGNTLLRLKFYYYSFPDDLDFNKIFTMNDSKKILGRDYALKTYPFKNKKYILTWYEF